VQTGLVSSICGFKACNPRILGNTEYLLDFLFYPPGFWESFSSKLSYIDINQPAVDHSLWMNGICPTSNPAVIAWMENACITTRENDTPINDVLSRYAAACDGYHHYYINKNSLDYSDSYSFTIYY